MAKSKTIRVTPNVLKCLEELKSSVKSMPASDLKKRAEGAIRYLRHSRANHNREKDGCVPPEP